MERTTDGFVIADEDLRLRGPGEFLDPAVGPASMMVADFARDADLLEIARRRRCGTVDGDPRLDAPEHGLRQAIEERWGAARADCDRLTAGTRSSANPASGKSRRFGRRLGRGNRFRRATLSEDRPPVFEICPLPQVLWQRPELADPRPERHRTRVRLSRFPRFVVGTEHLVHANRTRKSDVESTPSCSGRVATTAAAEAAAVRSVRDLRRLGPLRRVHAKLRGQGGGDDGCGGSCARAPRRSPARTTAARAGSTERAARATGTAAASAAPAAAARTARWRASSGEGCCRAVLPPRRLQ